MDTEIGDLIASRLVMETCLSVEYIKALKTAVMTDIKTEAINVLFA